MSRDRSYRIGEIAAATSVTVETLRFYEREGLLATSVRSPSGARRYGEEAVSRVRFIKQAQAVGLTLRDIRVLLKSRQNMSRGACKQTRTILAARIREIDERVQQMAAFRDVLSEHLRACDQALANHSAQDCPTVEAIERGDMAPGRGVRL